MALQIKGAAAAKSNPKGMKIVGRSPQGKDYFDVDRVNRMLESLYSEVEKKKLQKQNIAV